MQTQDEYNIEADLSGVKRKDLLIRYDSKSNSLLIDAHKEKIHNGSYRSFFGSYVYAERDHGECYRRIPLADDAETDSILATYSDGVLAVSIPRKPNSRNTIAESTNRNKTQFGLIEIPLV